MIGSIIVICSVAVIALPFLVEGFQSYLNYKQNLKQLEIKKIEMATIFEDKRIESAKEIRLSKNIIDLEKLMDD